MAYSNQGYNLLVWLQNVKGVLVSDYNEFQGVLTVIASGLVSDSFLIAFNRWNESNGIDYSIVRVKSDTWIIYPKNNNGVLISDLLKVKHYAN